MKEADQKYKKTNQNLILLKILGFKTLGDFLLNELLLLDQIIFSENYINLQKI